MGAETELAIVISARERAQAALSGVTKQLAGLQSAAKLAVGAAAALTATTAAGVGTFSAFAARAAATAGEVSRLARETGLSARQASELRYAAERLSLDVDSLSTNFTKFSKNVVENTDLFREYGVRIARTKDGTVDFQQTLLATADRFKAMPDGVEKTAMALELFGKQGKEMLPLLNQGSAGLTTLGVEAKRLGLIFDTDTIAAAKRLSSAKKDLGDAMSSVTNTLGKAFLPVMAEGAATVAQWAKDAVPAVTAALDGLRATVIPLLITKLRELAPIWTTVSTVARTAIDAIAVTIDALRTGKVGSLIDTIEAIFSVDLSRSAEAFIGQVVNTLRQIPRVVALVAGSIGEMFDVLTGRRPEAGGMLSELVGRDTGVTIMNTLAAVREGFKDAMDAITPVVQRVIDKVVELKAEWDKLPPSIREFAAAFGGGAVVAQVSGLDQAIGSILGGIGEFAQGMFLLGGLIPKVAAGIASLSLQAALAGGGIGGWLAALATAPALLLALKFAVVAFVVGGLIYIATHTKELGEAWDALSGIIRVVATFIANRVGDLFSAIGSLIQRGVAAVQEFFAPFGKLLTLFSKDAPYALGLFLGAVLRTIPTMLATFLKFAGDTMASFAQWFAEIRDGVGRWKDDVLATIGRFKDDAIAALGRLKDDALRSFGGMKDDFPKIAKDAVAGFIQGLFDAIPGVIKAAWDWAGRFLQGLKDALGIKSPSEEGAKIGESLAQGLALGLERGGPTVHAKLVELVASLSNVGAGLTARVAGALTQSLASASPTAIENIERSLRAITIQGGQIIAGARGQTLNAAFTTAGGTYVPGFKVGDAIVMPDGTVVYATPGLKSIRSYDRGGYVDRTGLAIVHRGERVLTPEQQRQTINLVVDGKVLAQVVNEHNMREADAHGGALE